MALSKEAIIKVKELVQMINESDDTVFFGGAGVSVESGIPDFRSENGLYSYNNTNYSPEEILSHSFFENHPQEFYQFYKEKMIHIDALPNMCHIALSKLNKIKKLKAIITQNIDGLHHCTHREYVLELHGSIKRNHCPKCTKSFDLSYIINSIGVPKCDNCGSIIKPDVVLYDESLDLRTLTEAWILIQNCTLLIVGGTSLIVEPAASLLNSYQGDKLVIINKTQTRYDNFAKLVIRENIGEVFSEVMKEMNLWEQ